MSHRLPVLVEAFNQNSKEVPCQYDIVFSKSFGELLQELAALGVESRRLCIITDSRVNELYGEEVLGLLQGKCAKAVKFVFPCGEENKNLDTVRDIYKFLIQ